MHLANCNTARLQSRQLSAAACCCCSACPPLPGHSQPLKCCCDGHSCVCICTLPLPPLFMPTPHVPATTPPSSPNVPVQEAHWMLDQGIQPDSNCASRGIGYRQALAALHHWRAHPGDLQPSQLVLTLDFSWRYGLLSISTLSCSANSQAWSFLAMLPWCALTHVPKFVDKKSLWT